MEHVAHELATRLPNHSTGLSPEIAAAYDPSENRRHYLEMQRVLANLRLRERAELGYAFDSTAQKLRNDGQGFVFRASFLDSKPDWVYVVGASKKIERAEVVSRLLPLLTVPARIYFRALSRLRPDQPQTLSEGKA